MSRRRFMKSSVKAPYEADDYTVLMLNFENDFNDSSLSKKTIFQM